MTELASLIDERAQVFARHPFLRRVRDPAQPLAQRLAFLPALSHFIMSFGDLNRYVLPFPAPRSELERAINEHAREDANHWPWFLHDLAQLGMDEPRPLTGALALLWSPQWAPARCLTYELVALVADRPANLRLVAIEVMEATGRIFFETMAAVTQGCGLELRFCGALHLSHEGGHTMTTQQDLLLHCHFTAAELSQGRELVGRAFTAFERLLDLLDQALEGRHLALS